ncbi:MAG: hypothetical protein LT071_09695 [Nocardioides sp.]|nr:hypothetical protein [Nocardioides sp.]
MDAPGQPRPSWQQEPCPPWCERTHLESDHLEDRFHQSEGTLVPAMVVDDPLSSPPTMRLTELVVVAVRHPGDSTTWIRVEAAEGSDPRLVVEAGAMHRLVPVLDELTTRLAVSA